MKAKHRSIASTLVLGMALVGLLQLSPSATHPPIASAGSLYVILDPGHGGSDPGAPDQTLAQRCGVPLDVKEKDRTLDIAQRVRSTLQANGIRVGMTRDSDTNPSLLSRTNYINQEKPNLSVSIHTNSGSINKETGAFVCGDGVEAWYSSIGPGGRPNPHIEVSRQLAQRLALKTNQRLGLRLRRNNGIADGNLHMVREPVVPSALIEMAFISNSTEATLLRDRPGEFAQAIAEAIMEQLGVTQSCPTGQYRAEYYNNRFLNGNPTFTRCDGSVNYDWGSGGPGNGVRNDTFSVRWTGRHNFGAGNYTIIARADDGIKVWVDGNLIIDAWRDQAPTEYRVTRNLSAGQHEIKVEYYENGGGAVAQFRWEQAVTGNRLIARHSGRCMDVNGGSRDSGTAIIQWDCHNGDNQLWNLVPAGNDYYRLVARHSGKCLDVYGASRDNGARLIQWDCHGGDNQLFKREQFGSYYRLRAKHSNRCVDVYGAQTGNGVRLIQWDCHSGNNQLWTIQPKVMAALNDLSEPEIDGGAMQAEYVLPAVAPYTIGLIQHTVEEGDSLELMAAVYEVAAEAIIAANPSLGGVKNIEVGKTLNVPVAVPLSQAPTDINRVYLPVVAQ